MDKTGQSWFCDKSYINIVLIFVGRNFKKKFYCWKQWTPKEFLKLSEGRWEIRQSLFEKLNMIAQILNIVVLQNEQIYDLVYMFQESKTP